MSSFMNASCPRSFRVDPSVVGTGVVEPGALVVSIVVNLNTSCLRVVNLKTSCLRAHEAGDGEPIQFDRFETGDFREIVAPRTIAQSFERARLAARAADVVRRPLDLGLTRGMRASLAVGGRTLTSDPIPVPYDGLDGGAVVQPRLHVVLGAHRRFDRFVAHTRRLVAFLLRTNQLTLRGLVLTPPQFEDGGRSELKSLHRGANDQSALKSRRASA
jgi:hypothetical protein